ncbi:14680_t:CDS:2, partial [Racocetra persica]
HLKLGSKRLPHILTSDIKWTYAINNPQPSHASTIGKASSQEDFDTELDNIKEKYATLSYLPQKRQRINMQNSSLNKPSSDKTTSLGFAEAISTEPNTETPIHLVPHVNENTMFTDDNDSTKLAYTNTPVPQNEKLDNNRKRLRPLLLAKK